MRTEQSSEVQEAPNQLYGQQMFLKAWAQKYRLISVAKKLSDTRNSCNLKLHKQQ